MAASKQRAVLLIEDDVEVRTAVACVLEDSGYIVHPCATCALGMRSLQEGLRPDLILLDLLTPDMTGWEFRVLQLRNAAWASIPTVALTACTSAEAQAIDADAYLIKPVTQQALTETVAQLIAEHDQAHVEAARRERERLNSLGVLASGIAHGVNNPLTYVVGNIDLARRHLAKARENDEPLDLVKLGDLLARAEDGANRAAAVVRRVAHFARPVQQETSAVDVAELVASGLQLVRNELRHRATIECRMDPAPPVLANAAQLGLVFLNLLLNAAYALDGRRELGRVVVSVDSQGANARVTITHSGVSLSSASPRRFSDVMHRRGQAGLWVATNTASSLRYLDELGAQFAVSVNAEHETVFAVLLKGAAAEAVPRDTSLPREAPKRSVGRPKVLVVDDEHMICDLVATYLEGRCDVTAATSGAEALALSRRGELFDVIVCDVMMPGFTGIELYEQWQKERPDQAERVVFMSGGTFTEASRTFFERPGMGYVQKPFSAPELLDAVERKQAACGPLLALRLV